MVIAIGAALGWAVLSVGPATLASDLDQVIPRDTVTSAVCGEGQPVHEDGLCSSLQQYVPPAWCPGVGIHWECIGPAQPQFVLTKPGCAASGLQGLIGPSQSPEADGKCHERSGGTVEPLMDDVVHGGQSGLLAFLAVGAALLLSPKLRAASQPQG